MEILPGKGSLSVSRGGDPLALGILVLGVVGIAWAPIFFRLSEVGPVTTAFWRVLLAIPLLYGWWLADFRGRRGTVPGPRGWRDAALLLSGGVLFAGDLVFWHWSLTWTSVANATLFANAAPVFVAILGWVLLGRRVGLVFLAGLVLAMAGAGVLMGASLTEGVGHLTGDLLAIVAAVFLAAYLLVVERLRSRFRTSTIMLWNAAGGAAVLFPLALATEDRLMPAGWQGWAVLAGLAAISHAAGQGLIAQAMSRLQAAFTSVSLLLQPLLAAVFAWMVLAEPLSLQQGIGGLVILAGIVLARIGSRDAGPGPKARTPRTSAS
ncbi:MAG: hypothetical protein RLY86_3875 [Pseudomonadota bacterium]|jgi:drug/metabolite transporter (DMT)-like permease